MQTKIKDSHDKFFKNLFSDINTVRDFLVGFLPEDLSKNLDFDNIKFSDTEKLDKKYEKYF